LISAAAMSAYFLHLEIKSRQYGCKINQQAGQSSHGLECGPVALVCQQKLAEFLTVARSHPVRGRKPLTPQPDLNLRICRFRPNDQRTLLTFNRSRRPPVLIFSNPRCDHRHFSKNPRPRSLPHPPPNPETKFARGRFPKAGRPLFPSGTFRTYTKGLERPTSGYVSLPQVQWSSQWASLTSNYNKKFSKRRDAGRFQ